MDHPERLVPIGGGGYEEAAPYWAMVSFLRESIKTPQPPERWPDHDRIYYDPDYRLFSYGIWSEIFRTPRSVAKHWGEHDNQPWQPN